MTVLCVNSGIIYADIASANAAEGGTDYGEPTVFEQSGSSLIGVTFEEADYPSALKLIAASGEEATGVIGVGANISGVVAILPSNCEVSNLRLERLNGSNAGNLKLRKLVVEPSGSDGVLFNGTINAEDILVVNPDDGFLSSVRRSTGSINRCTVVGANRFGYAQGVFSNCVDINSTNQGYFNEDVSSTNLWESDGTGTDTITEVPDTDIFENYALGDYRIKANSSVGLASAGAFINSNPTPEPTFSPFWASQTNQVISYNF